MTKLEDLAPNAAVRGVLPDALVTVVNVKWFGSSALELTYKDPAGRVANQLLYRHNEPGLEVVEAGRPWGFDGTAPCSAWFPRHTESSWPTCSIRCWRFTPR